MATGTWQLDALRIGGLVCADALLLAGLWLLWVARRRAEDERVTLPVIRRVSVPTCLTIALCMLAAGYHLLAYSLFPRFTLWAVPMDRWWIAAAAITAALLGAIWLERLESSREGGAGS